MTDQQLNFDGAIYGLPRGRPVGGVCGREPLEVLASQFVDALREHQRPSIQEYARQHPALAAEIEELFPLLAAMEEWKLFRQRTSFDHRSLTTPGNPQFGDYQVIREIGRGGMGIVFEAEERPSMRRVAIKVLPFLSSSQRRERFEREAQTAARLRHPHIVPVSRFGEHDGLCYYVMPLIRGVGLDWVIANLSGKKGAVEAKDISAGFENAGGTAADLRPARDETHWNRAVLEESLSPTQQDPPDHGRFGAFSAGISRNSWREFARIGAQVADALHYAHLQGTLHRDVKPANLLLDGCGNVWVTD
jgi:eukaryotic-like serine/threonine-protein kinase